MKDFFISYNRFDREWAEWIAWILEEAGYSVVIQAWDFRPGGNFILDMQNAATETKRTIAILSETYLKSAYTQPEWTAAFSKDPSSTKRKLIPIKVKECKPEGLLKQIGYVDLVGTSKSESKQELLQVLNERVKPLLEPNFPGEKGDVTNVKPADKQDQSASSLGKAKASSTAADSVKSLRRRNYKQQRQSLEEDYNLAFNQLEATNDEVYRKRLTRKIQIIEKELDKVAAQLDLLRE